MVIKFLSRVNSNTKTVVMLSVTVRFLYKSLNHRHFYQGRSKYMKKLKTLHNKYVKHVL